ncbi:YiiX/YebB-like N1pC/P60 family cysteine hydrolase [Phaeodactylibacter xiamenensis]|jgi:hypothetical protein|uniref:YiiX/YebB-like N1pC/P60 family cysteine hydrolase n=1 Tax=Phaeodactylibacter xiamenensis TaxID=1524460 RepID=UPI0009DF33E3|nr:YiiX/YebB-like N1pC/P60 family cysteine hydrolase [Phaeodactylibacter xiamenensis]MCR9055042.1 YiiX/YebB-like N1pC/P60 family cysteine hydrolase [bacterium]
MNRVLFCCLLLLLSFSCEPEKKAPPAEPNGKATPFDYTVFKLKAGDILFQDSDCGPFCESIEKVTFGIQGSKFSHVGMVAPKGKGEFVVLEAITAGVVETPLDSFFMRSFDEENNSKVAVGRMKKKYEHLIPKAIDFARKRLGAAYDEVFDISNDKYYCSELIYNAFKYANNDRPIFQLQAMTYVDPETDSIFPIWEDYFQELNVPVPEGQPGLNPGGMSMSTYIDIVYFYGKPQGYEGKAGYYQ